MPELFAEEMRLIAKNFPEFIHCSVHVRVIWMMECDPDGRSAIHIPQHSAKIRRPGEWATDHELNPAIRQ